MYEGGRGKRWTARMATTVSTEMKTTGNEDDMERWKSGRGGRGGGEGGYVEAWKLGPMESFRPDVSEIARDPAPVGWAVL